MDLGKLARELKPYILRWVDGVAAALRLDDIFDVDSPAPIVGNVLQFDGTNWIDADIDPTTTTGDLIFRDANVGGNKALLSEGATATAWGSQVGHDPSNAIDGDDVTHWISTSGSGVPDLFFKVDLGQVRNIYRWRLLQGNGSLLDTSYSFIISYSLDDIAYTPFPVHSSSGLDETQNLPSVAHARYIKFSSQGGEPGHYWYINTLELYELTLSYLNRRAIGNEADVLTTSSGLPVWLPPAAPAASSVTVVDAADYFTGAQVEAILAEIGLGWAKLARANTFTAKQVIVSADEPYSDLALDVHNGGGVELITAQVDRDFSGAGNWSGTNWAISSGTYLHTAGSTAVATLANANLTAGSVMAGRYYAFVFTISGMTTGNVTVKLGTGSGGVFVADGTYTAWMLANADDVDLTLTPSSAFNGAFDNLSLKLVPAKFAVNYAGRASIGTTVPDADTYLHVQVYDSGTVKLKFENLSANTGAAAAVECKVNNAARVLLIHGGSNVVSTTFGAFANRGGLITDGTYGLGIGIAARQAAGDIQFFAGGVANTNLKMTIGVNEVVVNDLGDPTVDLRGESDTEPNMIFLDSSADLLYLGGTTNSVSIAKGGVTKFNGSALKSGATQAAAGAAAGELWKTAGHSTLPDNVIMVGV